MIRTLKDIELGEAVPLEGFLDCQLRYYREYVSARENLKSSTQGLICHPEVSDGFKAYLLRFMKTI